MQPNWPIRRDFLPGDLEPFLQESGLDASIAVQARQSLRETEWLLELAASVPRICGVVGWVDLRSPAVDHDLERFAANPKFCGVRHVVQDEPDDEFMLRADFLRGIAALKAQDIVYDLLIFPKQLPAAIQLVRRFPEQRFVLDHIAKPPIREGLLEPWREQLFELAACQNVYCKVSGMVTEAQWDSWKPEDFKPYLDTVFEAFDTDRLMFGSDWPVCLLAASYKEVFGLVNNYISGLDERARQAVLGTTAARVYKIRNGAL